MSHFALPATELSRFATKKEISEGEISIGMTRGRRG